MAGMIGKVLHVDLQRGDVREKELSPVLIKFMLGGVGVASLLVSIEVPVEANALDAANRLVFMAGPLTGTTFPAATRYTVAAKSPLSDTIYSGGGGGGWGPELKAAGLDGILIEGKASKPVYLWVQDSKAELRDATQVWGLDALAAQEQIIKEVGQRRARAVSIGPAGERMARIAAIVGDTGQAAIFGGMGAVMGSKNLKAIVVRGHQRVPVADEPALTELGRKASIYLASNRNLRGLRAYGTAYAMEQSIPTGEVPVQNWRTFCWDEGICRLGGRSIANSYRRPYAPCRDCPVRCFSKVEVGEGKYQVHGVTPQYEALAALGSLCLNDNLESVCYASHLCDQYGLDPVAVGSAIAFAMETAEKGLISKEDAGIDLAWGNPEAVVGLTAQIGQGTGLGKSLGEGVKLASTQLDGVTEFTLHLKGLPVPMGDPRAFFSLAPAYATGFPGDPTAFERFLVRPRLGIMHKQGRFDKGGKGLAAKVAQDYHAMVESAGICPLTIPAMHLPIISAALEAATGETFTPLQAIAMGERTVNLQRLYANECGISAGDDRLPERLLTPAAEGRHAGHVPDLATQLEEYYELRGWDSDGRPTQQTLEKLGLA
jgi:aldehyde:ferredoxin oxidoreductase